MDIFPSNAGSIPWHQMMGAPTSPLSNHLRPDVASQKNSRQTNQKDRPHNHFLEAISYGF